MIFAWGSLDMIFVAVFAGADMEGWIVAGSARWVVLGMVEVFVSLGLDGRDDWTGERRTGLYTLIETSSSFED